MKKHNFKLRATSAFRMLFEQEDKAGDESEDAGDELFGGDEEDKSDEKKPDSDDEASDDEASSSDKNDKDSKGEDKSEDKKDKIALSAEDKARLEDSIDSELENLMVDYETDARKAAQVASEKMKSESLRRVYRGILYEVAADDIDLKHFASNLARLVKNYDTLLDMESIILNKAYAYIQNNYGEDTVKALKDSLEQDFDIDVERSSIEKDEPEIPIAVGGAGGEGGGVGGA